MKTELEKEIESLKCQVEALKNENDELSMSLREISIARHYYSNRNGFEDGRIRPAMLLEKAVAVAIDAWIEGHLVTITLCPEEVEQLLALVSVAGQDVTAFSMDLCDDIDCEPQEIWLSSQKLAIMDYARKNSIPTEP